jgi:ubiquinone/menaquinone biosynthesis C-methylase UbiE|tara:strand:- start:1307 stop:2110 length:804 start_codon:yes stop_codon:yes gene_type:complete
MTLMRLERPGPFMDGVRSIPLFRRYFGDAFPSNSNLAIDLCKRGGVSSSSQLVHLGCGPGTVSSIVSSKFGCTISGIDPSPDLIGIGITEWKREALEFECAPLDRCPLIDAWGTHLLTESRLSVVKNPSHILKEAHRLLSDDGILMNSELVVTNPSLLDDNVNRFLDTIFGQDADLSIDGWVVLIEENGFEIIEAREERQIMQSNRKKLGRAMMGFRLLQRTGRLSLSELGLGAFEDDFNEVVSSTLKAMDDGLISYGSFISKRSIP